MDFDRGFTLVDFINQERLEIFEEAVAEFTGMATIITDADGKHGLLHEIHAQY